MPLNINEKIIYHGRFREQGSTLDIDYKPRLNFLQLRKRLRMPHVCLSQTTHALSDESILVLWRVLPLTFIRINAEL